MLENIEKRLKILRKNILQMSQRQFAEHIDSNLRTVQNWECSRAVPELITLLHIAEKCDVSLDWLLGRDKCFTQDVSDMLEKIHDMLSFYSTLSEDKRRILEKHLKAAE